LAIEFVAGEKKPRINEDLCTGCGICIKKCPYDAISIVNLPEELESQASHRYGRNAFKLFKLPIPQPGLVTGLVGRNGTGKSTALKILSGELIPNLGQFEQEAMWETAIANYRGSLLQEYFERLNSKAIKVVHKPQYVDRIPERVSGTVSRLLTKVDERGKIKELTDALDLGTIRDREVKVLSGGELQRVAIAATIAREADVYIFDEPSSHLDVKQRLNAAKAIRRLAGESKTVLVAEHDLALLDYLSDQVCVIYGDPGVYGIVTKVHGVRVGINIYLDGYVPDENMRFRDEPIKFHVRPPRTTGAAAQSTIAWTRMEKRFKKFALEVQAGDLRPGEIIGILGPNGIGKTTFIKMLAGMEQPDSGDAGAVAGLKVSYKPQYISADYNDTVSSLLMAVADEKFDSARFQNELVTPLGLAKFMERKVTELSGGELQRVAIVSCLARDADLYLIDEPSAYLDVEERLTVARAIRRTIEDRLAYGFVVEHDILTQDFIADRLMVFDGKPGVNGYAGQPVSLRDGMNAFLSMMALTFRRDPSTGRPRANKLDSKLDREQKDVGEFYYVSAVAD
jgi:ATP-binding cassette subfamily E protein 1